MKKVLISCEHAGNRVPDEFRECFTDAGKDLNSHKGVDIGALDLFAAFVKNGCDFSIYSDVTRLLIDVNRSVNSGELFSLYTKNLPVGTQEKITESFYLPYRNKITGQIERFILQNSTVIHLSVHTFTPVLNQEVRKNDIGLLFDPARKEENAFCTLWKESIELADPGYTVMFNYPYKGTDDGLTTFLRSLFPVNYSGIEIEINQKLLAVEKTGNRIKKILTHTFLSVLRVIE